MTKQLVLFRLLFRLHWTSKLLSKYSVHLSWRSNYIRIAGKAYDLSKEFSSTLWCTQCTVTTCAGASGVRWHCYQTLSTQLELQTRADCSELQNTGRSTLSHDKASQCLIISWMMFKLSNQPDYTHHNNTVYSYKIEGKCKWMKIIVGEWPVEKSWFSWAQDSIDSR